MMDHDDHVFVICAYEESAYLENCIRSLLAQTEKSRIMITTSTPNTHISLLARRYAIPLFVNERSDSIAADWEYAYEKAREYAGYVTIAHQDDHYLPHFAEAVLGRLEKENDAMLCFTDYAELRRGKCIDVSPYTAVKRTLLLPLRFPGIRMISQTKRWIIAFGNPIMCPSVTYNVSKLPEKLFTSELKSNVDWETWEKLSKLPGRFIYEPHTLLLHRIHEKATTAQLIYSKEREKEDHELFCRFWPETIVKCIMKVYSLGERNYSFDMD